LDFLSRRIFLSSFLLRNREWPLWAFSSLSRWPQRRFLGLGFRRISVCIRNRFPWAGCRTWTCKWILRILLNQIKSLHPAKIYSLKKESFYFFCSFYLMAWSDFDNYLLEDWRKPELLSDLRMDVSKLCEDAGWDGLG
jgi:hypothetical protein